MYNTSFEMRSAVILCCLLAFVQQVSAQNAIILPDDGTTRTNLGDDSILEYGYTPGSTMLFEVWKKMPSDGIANKANDGSFNIFAAWRGRVEPVGEASLKVFSVTKDDAGQYQLSTTFSDGTADSKERTLIVQFAPEDTTVTASPGLVAKENDAQVVLTCQAGGIPAPTYTWTGDNLPADAAQDPNTGTLTITNIQRSAAGQYTCTADNGVPQLHGDDHNALTNSVNVQVQSPTTTTPNNPVTDGVGGGSFPIGDCVGSGTVAGAAVGCLAAGMLLGGAVVFLFLRFRAAAGKKNPAGGNISDDEEYEDVRPGRAASNRTGIGNDDYEVPMETVHPPFQPPQLSGDYQELRPAVYQSLQKN